MVRIPSPELKIFSILSAGFVFRFREVAESVMQSAGYQTVFKRKLRRFKSSLPCYSATVCLFPLLFSDSRNKRILASWARGLCQLFAKQPEKKILPQVRILHLPISVPGMACLHYTKRFFIVPIPSLRLYNVCAPVLSRADPKFSGIFVEGSSKAKRQIVDLKYMGSSPILPPMLLMYTVS